LVVLWKSLSPAVNEKLGSDVIGHATIGFPIGPFLLVVLWNQAFISNGFRNIQWRM